MDLIPMDEAAEILVRAEICEPYKVADMHLVVEHKGALLAYTGLLKAPNAILMMPMSVAASIEGEAAASALRFLSTMAAAIATAAGVALVALTRTAHADVVMKVGFSALEGEPMEALFYIPGQSEPAPPEKPKKARKKRAKARAKKATKKNEASS